MLNSNYLIILGMCLVTLVIMLLIMPGLIDYLHKIKFGLLRKFRLATRRGSRRSIHERRTNQLSRLNYMCRLPSRYS